MRVIALGFAAMLAGWAMPAAAQSEPIRNFEGACSGDSKVGGAAYVCNAMIYAQIDPQGARIMLMFAQKGDDSRPMIAIGGDLNASGTLVIDGIQLTAGDRTPFSGNCAFKRSGSTVKSVRCTATESGGSGRTVSVDFSVSSEFKPKS